MEVLLWSRNTQVLEHSVGSLGLGYMEVLKS